MTVTMDQISTQTIDQNLAIYIPAYNAALTLPGVLDRIPSQVRSTAKKILVVDNHSSDNTSLVALDYKSQNGLQNLEVIRNEKNVGYGGSQKVGYQHCIDQDYRFVVMLHSDGQYAPELIEKIIAPLVRGEAEMVFGSRMAGDPRKGGMPFHRYWGNRVLTTIQNWTLGSRFSEFHSGYRAFSVEALKKVPFQRLSSDYHFDTEMIILFRQAGLRIAEFPIPTHYGDEKNYVNIWKYGMDCLVTTTTYWLHTKGIRHSRNWARILAK